MQPITQNCNLFVFIDELASQSERVQEFNQFLLAQNINANYKFLNIENNLNLIMANLKNSQFQGAEIGKNFQEEVIDLLDEVSPEVKKNGFVEVIKIKNQKLIGYISIGKALASFIGDKKVAVFGSNKVVQSLIYNLENLSNLTVVEKEIEHSANLLEDYPELDIRFSDEHQPFNVEGYEFIVKCVNYNIYYNMPIEIITPNSAKIKNIQYSVALNIWS